MNNYCNNGTKRVALLNRTMIVYQPPIETITGNMLINGDYVNTVYKGYRLEVFYNGINRFLNINVEYALLEQGGIKILMIENWTINDVFKIIPNGLK